MEKIRKNSSVIYKIISVLIAVILWAYVAYQENTEINRWIKDVPITVTGTDILDQNGFCVTGTDRSTVDVRIRGERGVLSKVTVSDISAVLDVSTVNTAGSTALNCDITVDRRNVEVSDSRKNSVTVSTEKMTTDIFPISANIVGAPAKGYSVFEPSVYPTEVTIRGAESTVNSIASVATKSVSVSGVNKGSTVSAGLTAFDAEGRAISGLTFDPAAVEVRYSILLEKTVPLTVPALSEVPGAKITYEPKTVKIYGSSEALSSVSEIVTEAIDYASIKDGDTVSVNVDLPYGIQANDRGGMLDVTFTVEEAEPDAGKNDDDEE